MKENLKERLTELFYGQSRESLMFNRALLVFNVIAIFVFILDPIFHGDAIIRSVELVFGIVFLVEYLIRFWIAQNRLWFVFKPINLVDLVVVVSCFAPIFFGNFTFLRVVRALRVLRFYRLLEGVNHEKSWVRVNEDVIFSFLNLFVFVFIMTDIVFVSQSGVNDSINNYLDALYFTLTTLTTTGFGDITLQGTNGRLLAVIIMVFGITLFVKLARDIIRPPKVYFKCPDCGLTRHDPDSTHCKHCGRLLNIETEGEN